MNHSRARSLTPPAQEQFLLRRGYADKQHLGATAADLCGHRSLLFGLEVTITGPSNDKPGIPAAHFIHHLL